MSARPRRRALLVGTEHYVHHRLADLPCTRADIAGLGELLRHPEVGGYDVTEVRDRPAREIRHAVADFLEASAEDELVLLYVTGHGARLVGSTGEFAFATTDTDPDDPVTTGVGAGFVNDLLEGCFARQKVAVLDTCVSGGFALGFRTRDEPSTKAATDRSSAGQADGHAEVRPPVTPSGVFILSSSAADEASFGGGGTDEDPQPSLFTGALCEVLRAGSAGAADTGDVGAEELFHAVREQIGSAGPTPVTSSLHVKGRIHVADRPRGPIPAHVPAPPPPGAAPSSSCPDADPDWPRFLRFLADVVDDEGRRFEPEPLPNGRFAVLPGRERFLTGDIDADDAVAVPSDAAAFAFDADGEDLDVWAGWPAVVVTVGRQRTVAPALIRRIETHTGPDGTTRLRPTGTVVPHPGLVDALLEDAAAVELRASYQPSWRAGERDRLRLDAAELLGRLGVTLRAELQPGECGSVIEAGDPVGGAHNVAMLVTAAPSTYDSNLLKDLHEIAERHEEIRGTALAALLDPAAAASTANRADPEPLPVLPRAANAAQRAVLGAAFTGTLTVATGPPGTGKSQLIADVVATAVAGEQTVLLASTNNPAVDEVARRCRDDAPGSIVRTGSRYRDQELADLRALRDAPASGSNLATRRVALRHALEQDAGCRSALRDVAGREARRVEVSRAAREAAARLGTDPGERIPDGTRCRSLARARLLGEWRRRWFLRRSGLSDPLPQETAAACLALADLADARHELDVLTRELDAQPPDDVLAADLGRAGTAISARSVEVLQAALHDAARTGRDALVALERAVAADDKTWALTKNFLPHVRAWAVSCQSVRRRFFARPGLFDLVVIDEASQVSISHAVPLLFRARRALLIGDVMQLPPISTMSARRERELRERHGLRAEVMEERGMLPRRHSSFHLAERAAGAAMLLDEHFRCHPMIADLTNELFYGGELTVLTDVSVHARATEPAIEWRHVCGEAQPGPDGRSWRNEAEVRTVGAVLAELRREAPAETTFGLVTPYRPQADELVRLRTALGADQDEVQVGTVHAFQGGERDVMVVSLVAARNQPPARFDWFDRQRRLWNVAITRARQRVVVVGDRDLWQQRGGIGARLTTAGTPSGDVALDSDLADLLYGHLIDVDPGVQLAIDRNGYRADAVLTSGQAVFVDPGPAADSDDGIHLDRMLRRRTLLADNRGRCPARRVPRWELEG